MSRENYVNKKLQKLTSLGQKLQTNRQNKYDYNKPRSAVSSTLNVSKENQKTTKKILEEEIKQLKNEVASLKKHHITK